MKSEDVNEKGGGFLYESLSKKMTLFTVAKMKCIYYTLVLTRRFTFRTILFFLIISRIERI